MSSVISNTTQALPLKINKIRAFEVAYYFALAIPLIVGFCFYFLVVKERLYTGHWPFYDDPSPAAPLGLFSFFSFFVAILGVAPAIFSIFIAMGMTVYSFFDKAFSKKKLLICIAILLVDIVLLTMISKDIGGFGTWIAD